MKGRVVNCRLVGSAALGSRRARAQSADLAARRRDRPRARSRSREPGAEAVPKEDHGCHLPRHPLRRPRCSGATRCSPSWRPCRSRSGSAPTPRCSTCSTACCGGRSPVDAPEQLVKLYARSAKAPFYDQFPWLEYQDYASDPSFDGLAAYTITECALAHAGPGGDADLRRGGERELLRGPQAADAARPRLPPGRGADGRARPDRRHRRPALAAPLRRRSRHRRPDGHPERPRLHRRRRRRARVQGRLRHLLRSGHLGADHDAAPAGAAVRAGPWPRATAGTSV